MNRLSELMAEYQDLILLDSTYEQLLVKLKASQYEIKHIIAGDDSWRAGKSQEAYKRKLESYLQTFGVKIEKLQFLRQEIDEAKSEIQSLMTAASLIEAANF
ncbi:hypothetical protein [Peribacillus sp. SCS-37]|uniref:hypothetical protein n=1 Tax=Paraperibacillus esterisolvens TaxID=3115296 RepID=UPI003906715C